MKFFLRYAATNTHHEKYAKKGVSVYYVVANPSRYLYIDGTRYHFEGNGEIRQLTRAEMAHCEGYNRYKYGLEKRYGYANLLSVEEIKARLMKRPLVFLLGQEDTKRSWSLDKACEVEVQGHNRYERGLLHKHHWLILPGVGHNSNEIFTHNEVVAMLQSLVE